MKPSAGKLCLAAIWWYFLSSASFFCFLLFKYGAPFQAFETHAATGIQYRWFGLWFLFFGLIFFNFDCSSSSKASNNSLISFFTSKITVRVLWNSNKIQSYPLPTVGFQLYGFFSFPNLFWYLVSKMPSCGNYLTTQQLIAMAFFVNARCTKRVCTYWYFIHERWRTDSSVSMSYSYRWWKRSIESFSILFHFSSFRFSFCKVNLIFHFDGVFDVVCSPFNPYPLSVPRPPPSPLHSARAPCLATEINGVDFFNLDWNEIKCIISNFNQKRKRERNWMWID